MMILNHDEQDLLQRKALITAREIENQPVIWKKLAGVLTDNKSRFSAYMDKISAIPNLRVIFTGAGSSAFIGESMSMLLMKEFGLRSECQHTTDVVATPEEIFYDVPTLLVSYSRSGSSPESCAAIETAKRYVSQLYNLVLVCNADSPLARIALDGEKDLVVNIPQEASDQGFAMTCSVSCMALATWVLFSGREMDKRIAYISTLADSVAAQMGTWQKQAAEIGSWDYTRIVYLGFGALRGLAREGCVKSQELTNGYTMGAFDTPTGFRHGPKTMINDETLIVMMATPLKLAGLYDYDMIRELSTQKVKNRVAVVVSDSCKYDLSDASYVIRYQTPAEYAGAEINAYMYCLMFLQLLSFERSYALGITTDNPCPKGEVNRVVQGVIVHNPEEIEE